MAMLAMIEFITAELPVKVMSSFASPISNCFHDTLQAIAVTDIFVGSVRHVVGNGSLFIGN